MGSFGAVNMDEFGEKRITKETREMGKGLMNMMNVMTDSS